MTAIETITVTKSGRGTKVVFRGLEAALSFEIDDPGNVRVGLVHSSAPGAVLSVVVTAADARRVARELLSIAGGEDSGLGY